MASSVKADCGSSVKLRARLPKVRTGCLVCKARHLKCDEQRPYCERCTLTGRKCDGYVEPAQIQRKPRRSKYSTTDSTTECTNIKAPKPSEEANSKLDAIISPHQIAYRGRAKLQLHPGISLGVSDDVDERRSFHYFRTRTVQDISGCFDSGFWDYLVLQVSHAEPTVRHALLALSSVYESYEASASSVNTFALQQYAKAVSLLANDLSSHQYHPQVVLMSCLIFIWFEILQDNLDTALNHLKSGLRILQDQLQSGHPQRVDQSLVHLFTRLHIQATTHGSPTSDYNPNPSNKDSKTSNSIPSDFASILEARQSLDNELDMIFQFHRRTEDPGFISSTLHCHPFPDPLSLESIRRSHLHNLQQWQSAMENMPLSSSKTFHTKQYAGICLLQLQQMIARNTLNTLFAASPMIFDDYNHDYERMLSLAHALIKTTRQGPVVLSFDIGVIAALFYILLKCRDLGIRRKAMALLIQAPAREGMWLRECAVQYAEWKFGMEEQRRRGLPDTDPLPESARIYGETAREMVVDGKRVTVLCFMRGKSGPDGESEFEQRITDLSMRMAGLLGTGRPQG